MKLSPQSIEKFQQLYKARFGKDLSREEAYEKGAWVVQMMAQIYKPITHNELHELQRSDTTSDNS